MTTATTATISLSARVGPDTEYRSRVVDPMPGYPKHAGNLAVALMSGGFVIEFSQGYAPPEEIHDAIFRLHGALDQLEFDVDAAMERQAAALPDGVEAVPA